MFIGNGKKKKNVHNIEKWKRSTPSFRTGYSETTRHDVMFLPRTAPTYVYSIRILTQFSIMI